MCSHCCLPRALAQCLTWIVSNWAKITTSQHRKLLEALDSKVVQVRVNISVLSSIGFNAR